MCIILKYSVIMTIVYYATNHYLVVPGYGETIAAGRRAIRFKTDDLPKKNDATLHVNV